MAEIRHGSAGARLSREDSDRQSGGLLSFLSGGPYEPLVTREQVLERACGNCGAQAGAECDTRYPRPAFAGLVLRGMAGVHLRRYQDTAHDPR